MNSDWRQRVKRRVRLGRGLKLMRGSGSRREEKARNPKRQVFIDEIRSTTLRICAAQTSPLRTSN